MDFLALRNCSNLTDEQVRAVAFVRGITAAVCCFLLFVVLVAIFILAKADYQKVCGTVVKHLAVGFTVASVLQQFTLALSLNHYFNPGLERFCETFMHNGHTVFALIYGTAKNNCIGDHFTLIRMC